MLAKSKGSLDVLVPRGLLGSGLDLEASSLTAEGLASVRVEWDKARINAIQAISLSSDRSLKLLLPRLVEPHTHLDKAFSWENFPNLAGTYAGALNNNLNELETRTCKDVCLRSEKALNIALKNGLRAIRSHVDSYGGHAEKTWEVLQALKIKWKRLIELQLVALVPLEYWSTNEGDLFAARISSRNGLMGGVIVPPLEKGRTYDLIFNTLKLANKYNCGVDLHIDESQEDPAAGLNQLIRALENMSSNIPVSCSHLSSLSLLSNRKLKVLSEKIVKHNINVIALPLTNSWLLGRYSNKTLLKRPMAPIYQLQTEGVRVSVGGDNVQDPWFPGGNLDPIMLMSFSLPLAQLAPWERLGLAPFTTSPASLFGLSMEGTIDIGSPADFIILNAGSWAEALSSYCSREIIVNGESLAAVDIPLLTVF